MLVHRNISWKIILHYTWKSLLYYISLAITVYILHDVYGYEGVSLPFDIQMALSTALAIFLGFKNNNAYDRWWEGRKIWGLLVNYSRAWARQVIVMIIPPDVSSITEVKALQKRMVYRHIAFVHALRVFLRQKNKYNVSRQEEFIEARNDYTDTIAFLNPHEYRVFCEKNNPPNYLLELQGDDLKRAYLKGWISDFRFVKLEETLVEFNNHQGMAERIKNTPLIRTYSFFSRVFVFIHASLMPFSFIELLGWLTIPVAVIVSFVFLALDLVGERTEDPFENRLEDVALTAISLTIETNLKEQWGAKNFPKTPDVVEGIVL